MRLNIDTYMQENTVVLHLYICLYLFFKQFLAVGSIVGGSWLLYQRDDVENNKTNFESVFDLTTDLGAYLIAIGVFGIIFSIIGLAATIRENILFLKIVILPKLKKSIKNKILNFNFSISLF